MAGSSSLPRYSSLWTTLDTYVRFNYPLSQPEKDATYARSTASTGEPIAVLLRAVSPPGASRLYVYMSPRSESLPGRRRALDRSYVAEPRVVAAHTNSILLQVPLSNQFDTPHSDFFIYTLTSTGPSLRLLPHCTDRMPVVGFGSTGLEHMLTPTDIGVLCHGDDRYVVADLQVLPLDSVDPELCTPLEAQLCILRSSRWEATRPLIKHKKEEASDLLWWSTDDVVPWGDSVLCYVDYLRGILCADVRTERPQLQYIRLPVRVPSGDPVDPDLGTRGCPKLLRRLCITQDGTFKFVDIVCTTVFEEGCRSPVSSSFTIKLWKLIRETSEIMTWVKECDLQDSELWSLLGFEDIPHVVPEFPVINMRSPNLLYFVVSKDGDDCVDGGKHDPADVADHDNTWIMLVDISNKTLKQKERYTKVGGISKYDGEMASRNIAFNDVFIPCEFSMYDTTRKRKNQG